MRKVLLLSVLLLFSYFTTYAAKEDSFVLYQGFEQTGGSDFSLWTQDYVLGNQSWQVINNAQSEHPNLAYRGEHYILLRNEAEETLGYTTRLVTPVMNIGNEVISPVLIFWRAQEQRTGDIDTLRVWYRTSPNSGWAPLKTYSDRTRGWVSDTVPLRTVSPTYQLAFEASDNMGWGVALDEIAVRPAPVCETPTNLSIRQLSDVGVTLDWLGSLDTEEFMVVLASQPLPLDSVEDDKYKPYWVKDTVVADFRCHFADEDSVLTGGTKYWAYVKSICPTEMSDFAEIAFQSITSIAEVPYVETFNGDYTSNPYLRPSTWAYGTTTTTVQPIVDANRSGTIRFQYTHDATAALTFCNSTSASTTPIPAGEHTWAVAPLMNDVAIKDLEVTLWAGSNTKGATDAHNPRYAASLIIGVMSDPYDFETFEHVDTVTIYNDYAYARFTVSLDSYTGTGKYIAFASDFEDLGNFFILNEVRIDYKQKISIDNVKITDVLSDSLTIKADMKGATAVNVVVAKHVAGFNHGYKDDSHFPVEFPYVLPQDSIIATFSNQTLPARIGLPAQDKGCFVQVYVQAVNGTDTSMWAVPQKVQLPAKYTPGDTMKISFEELKETADTWRNVGCNNLLHGGSSYKWYPYNIRFPYIYNGESDWPLISTSSSQDGKNNFPLAYNGDGYARYLVLPQVDTISDVSLVFYMKGNTTAGTLKVGVMTDPNDIRTFEQVAFFAQTNTGWNRHEVRFTDYAGKGKFICLQVAEHIVDGKAKSHTVNVDNIQIMPAPECPLPSGMEAFPADTTAEFTWDKGIATQWQVEVFTKYTATSQTPDGSIAKAVVDTPYYKVGGLSQHTTYYYQVSTICADTTIAAEVLSFETECLPVQALPYEEDFSAYTTAKKSVATVPYCWTMPIMGTSSAYYPTVYNSGGNKAKHALYFGADTTTAYFALPKLDAVLSEIQFNFWAKAATAEATEQYLLVGIMTDPEDTTTFTAVDTLRFEGTAHKEYFVTFENYNGPDGYIAVVKPNKEKVYYYFDDIYINTTPTCTKIENVFVSNVGPTGATLRWTKSNADKWEVLVASKSLTEAVLKTVTPTTSGVVLCDTVDTNPYTLNSTKLAEKKTYYIYVRGVCSETDKAAWSNGGVSFTTICAPRTMEELEEDFADATNMSCWTLGFREGTKSTTYPAKFERSTNKYFYLENSTKNDGSYGIMPAVDVEDIRKLRLSFDAHGGNTAADARQLMVGIMTDPTDWSTFMEIKSIALERATAGVAAGNQYGFAEALRYDVSFANYKGDANGNMGKYIVFLSVSGSQSNKVYIDNISLAEETGCLSPTDVTITDIEDTRAVLRWEHRGDTYQVQVTDKPMTDSTHIVLQDTVAVADTLQLEGLRGLTTYYVYVRTQCEGGETSAWTHKRFFRTTCEPSYDLPWSHDFEEDLNYDVPTCWHTFNVDQMDEYDVYPKVSTTAKQDGKQGLALLSTINNNVYAALPKIDANLNQAMLRFSYKASGGASGASTSNERNMAIGIAEDVSCLDSLLTTMTILDTIIADHADGWMEYVNVFSDYTGDGHYYVLFSYGGGNGTNTSANGVYIDNIEVTESPACITPISLEATRITSTSVTFSWEQPIQKVKTWEAVAVLVEKDKKDIIIDETKAVRVDTTEATLTGLEHTSDYNIYVRAVCGEGNVSEWSEPLAVSTLCLVAPEAAIWDFEGGKDDLECWTLGNTKSTSTSYIPSISKNTSSLVYAKSGEQALKIYTTTGYTVSTGAYAIMPEIDADLDTMQLRFSGRALRTQYSKNVFSQYYTTLVGTSYAHAVEVGVLSDPSDWDTFESLYVHEFKVVASKPQVEGDHWEDITLPLYGAKGKYIVFRSWFDKQNEIYLDDIIVEPASCARPIRVAVNDTTLTDKHADFTWSSAASEWNVRITEALTGNVVAEDTVTTASYSIDTLQTATSYIFAVQSACANEDSDWTEIEFNTAYSLDVAHWNFEDSLYQYGTSATYLIPRHWTTSATNYSDNSYPYARANTSSSIYAHNPEETTNQRALFFSTSTSNEQFAILPQLAFDLEDLALHFYGRATYATKTSTTEKVGSGNASYQRYLVLGTVEGTDTSTFVPLDTVRYDQILSSGTLLSNDETGNKYWQEYSVPMRNYMGATKRIAIKSPKASNQIHIDDVDFISAGFCNIVTGLKADDIHTTQVALHWNNEDQSQVQLQVATDKEYTEESVLVDVTLTDASYIIDGLQAQRNYYFRLKRLCDVDKESEWCPSSEFRTADTIQFYQDFSYVIEEEKRQQPLYWERYERSATRAMDQNEGIGNPISLTKTGSWRRDTVGVGLAGNHIHVQVFGATTDDWLVSPIISLEEVATEKLVLSFDLALTGNLAKPAKEPTMDGTDDKFIVAVSLDEGKTWLRENTTVWSNDSAGTQAYIFNEIPYEGRTYYVDFTKYAGKVITLGFYVESTEENASNYLHLDNVALNRLTTIPYAENRCRWNDFTDRHFDIDAYDLQIGTTEYEHFYPAHGEQANDSLYVLNLTVTSDTTVTYNATVCEGEAYTEYGFDIQHALSGTYKRKLQGVNTCDSTVVLNLAVIPKQETRIEETICQGNYYEFNGEKYYTSTVHTDTLSSLVTGCDSIVTLYLTVKAILTGSEDVHLCPGTSVNFGKFGDITTAGTYVDTLVTDQGCDSVVTLTVYQEEVKQTLIRAAICQGEEYRDDVFRGLNQAGDYTSTQTTVYGCDSIVTLHLLVAAEDLTLNDSIAVADLPYVLNGVELLPKGTAEGVYTKVVSLGCGDALIAITVGDPTSTGLNSIFTNSLAVAPNPIEVGVPIRVLTSFADDQLDGMVVSVYDVTGMLVGRQYPTAAPIMIEGLPVAGAYLVSIQTGGRTYQTKLVVK